MQAVQHGGIHALLGEIQEQVDRLDAQFLSPFGLLLKQFIEIRRAQPLGMPDEFAPDGTVRQFGHLILLLDAGLPSLSSEVCPQQSVRILNAGAGELQTQA